MSHISKSNNLSFKEQLLHPCRFRGRHAWLRKYVPDAEAYVQGLYRQTCVRCGEWEERAGGGALLLTSRDVLK